MFSSGSRLGPYEILAPLGAGGMGQVYRARDTRLAREVAVKVLPEEVSGDRSRLSRFEKEARAASALNHPNIVTIYEIGSEASTFYIAMERVDGQTLREILAGGPIPTKKLLGIAAQIADGLARAHEAGIVHRDLKPENVMVTKDGLVKILDFGLAKLTRSTSGGADEVNLPTETQTSPGVVVGTASYMSPEQAGGEPVDFRSDQFAFGSILYEMATGRRAFQKRTGVDTLAAILNDEPEAIAALNSQAPAPIRWVVERCLAKEAGDRYAATRDLAREIASLKEHLSEASSSGAIGIVEPRPKGRRMAMPLAVAILAAVAAGAYFVGMRVERSRAPELHYRQLTFRGAGIGTARFAPDGQTIVFSSQTEGKPPELFSMRLDSPEVRSLGLPPAQIMSIAPDGEMAILVAPPFALGPRVGHLAYEQVVHRDPFLLTGTVAEVPLGGGAPREILEDVMFADWAPSSETLAVVHRSGNRNRVEFPVGKNIFETEGVVLNHPRVSPKGDRIAFKDWTDLFVVDAGRAARGLRSKDAWEIAWSPVTGEIWYDGHQEGRGTEIRAISPSGRDRLVGTLSGDHILYDISADGRVLLGRNAEVHEIFGRFPGEGPERNLSHFISSEAVALSAGGDSLVFNEGGMPDSPNGIYVRRTEESSAKRLRDGSKAYAVSPDGRFVLAQDWGGDSLWMVPVGPGQTKRVETPGVLPEFIELERARFLPDAKSIVFTGREPGRNPRIWLQDLGGGKPRALSPESVRRPVLLGGGHFVCARAADLEWRLFPVEPGASRKVLGLLSGEEPFDSTPDGLLYVRGADELRPGETLMTTRIYRLDPVTGRRELWTEIPPRDPRTGGAISSILLSADGKICVWTHIRYSTELVLAEGLR